MPDAWNDEPGAAPAAAEAVEANEPDLIDQQRLAEREPDGAPARPRLTLVDPEVPEADAWEQSLPVGREDDDY